jgi:very-short-patch-repair endonuclease
MEYQIPTFKEFRAFCKKHRHTCDFAGNSEAECNHKLPKTRRKQLRNNLTPAEAALWECIKNSQLKGKKFRRQHSIGSYIVDFYCPELKLVIELDGQSHDSNDQYLYDQRRTNFLFKNGIKVIRFENKDVLKNLDGVLVEIQKCFR